MKNVISAIFGSVAVALLVSCSSEPFRPVASSNPWPDDYMQVAVMDSASAWGTYNVHDPAVCKVGDTYYMFSTDAIYFPPRHEKKGDGKKHERRRKVDPGFIQARKSTDLVNWEFAGWVFPEIPAEAVEWVKSQNDGEGAGNVWAPYMVDCGNGKYHLYYCVSAFGKNTSYIGLAESTSPDGPWSHVGAVVKTSHESVMNAIDPTVITAPDGHRYMHYGSYFGGLFCVELDSVSGFPIVAGDQGHLVARRANWRKDNLEAPEIIRNPQNGMYYLFGSYDPLMTTYNVRVCRSESPTGPFIDFHGKEMADTTDNFPILTAPYRFENHAGWVGTAHCGVFADAEGNFYMAHQGRLASNPGMMDLHIRQVFFTPDGWPVVSPERYAATPRRTFADSDLEGDWEVIRVHEPIADRNLEAGQILWGEGDLLDGEWNVSFPIALKSGGNLDSGKGKWKFDTEKQSLSITLDGEDIQNLIIFAGHDWEREQDTVLFTGLDRDGRSVWGKRVG